MCKFVADLETSFMAFALRIVMSLLLYDGLAHITLLRVRIVSYGRRPTRSRELANV